MLKPIRKDFIDMTGQKFGSLTVIEYAGRDKKTKKCASLWECLCACGDVIITRRSSLVRGATTSCGCEQKIAVTIHGKLNTPTYHSWQSMKQRCLNPKAPNYSRYGGKGVKIHKPWVESFENFLADMGERPRGTTLDRYPDTRGNYEPKNCRWSSCVDQNNNKRNNTLILINGKNLTVTQAAKIYNIKPNTVFDRIKIGWDVMEALSTPVRKKKARL